MHAFPASAQSPFRWLAPLAAVLIALAAYWPVHTAEFLNYDDDIYVTGNDDVVYSRLGGVLTEPVGGNLHPVTMFSLWLNYRITGSGAAGFHWGNLLLHLLNVWLVWLLARRLLGGQNWPAFFTALIWGVHPLHVESVAWVAERKDVLYAAFLFAGLLAYSRYLLSANWLWLLVTFLWFILSILSKPAAIPFPVLLLCMDYLGKRKGLLRMALEKIPFFLVAGAMAWFTLQWQKDFGAVKGPDEFSMIEKFFMSSAAWCAYIGMWFWPSPMSVVHPFPLMENGLPWYFYAAPAGAILLFAGALLMSRKSRIPLFGLLFYTAMVFLILQIISFGESFITERYSYVPSFGITLIIAWALHQLFQHLKWRNALWAAACLLPAIPLAPVTWNRCMVWQTSETLWTDVIQQYPDRVMTAWINRGDYYISHNRPQDARWDFEKAVQLDPSYSPAYFNRGNAYFDLNFWGLALRDYTIAIDLGSDDPRLFNNRGVLHNNMELYEEAVKDFTQAIELAPRTPLYFENRAIAWEGLGMKQEALSDIEKVRELGKEPSPDLVQRLNAM